MSGTTDETVLDAGQCGDRVVPDEYREVAGWKLQEHDYVLENVGDFWGGHRVVKGFVPWEAERYGHRIEDVALVAVERRGSVVWKLQRQHFLGDSYDVNNHPRDRHSDRREADFGDALEMAHEWLEHNPACTASSLFVPPDPDTDDPVERFSTFIDGEIEQVPYGLVNEYDTIALVTDAEAKLPQGDALRDFVAPDEVDVGDRFVTARVGDERHDYAFKNFSPYGFVTGEGEEAPLADRLRVSPATSNALVELSGAEGFLVAPLNDEVS